MDSRAPKKKGERIPFEKREYLPGKWRKEDKKKIGKSKTRPEDKIEIQKKLDAALKKLRK
jgi:hypothetical protein